ncbi:MAG: aminopeptidase N [Pseudomonadota bacterium]
MRTDVPQTIHRQDYVAPDYLVDTVEIAFDLTPAATYVSMRMIVQRNANARSNTLLLNGEQLTLIALRVDGKQLTDKDFRLTSNTLEIPNVPATATVEIETQIKPLENTSLSGLYMSGGNFFTQCEAEGFRRITYFPDRPDVMAKYTVMLRADKMQYPVLLSNGNLIEEGDLGDGRHFAKWEDPFKKPSYLFALVAGKLVCQEEWFEQRSGHRALLQIWVEDGNLDKTEHAMQSLKNSIRWDAERFDLELDLDRFMIVAVSDFNMGAMENKGLNIFNTKFVLANPRIATDTDYANIESVVGHEYFHNWTGNRVTCRDWFQLSLKEGLTVFRDQEFSADLIGTKSGRAVKRIEDVRLLRQAQFPEDAGPMAHPVRPDSYVEINNFYTLTIYEKGSEVVRMYQTLLGREGFRKGMDLYFARHDGQAVTCDDFRAAMADANERDLSQFERWYSQAGTPRVQAKGRYDADAQTYELSLSQYCAATPGQLKKLPFHIPFNVGLLDENGQDFPLKLAHQQSMSADLLPTTMVLELTEDRQLFQFVNIASVPTPSLMRNFSAPVVLEYDYSDEDLAFLSAHDSDAFNRWEAGQRLAMRCLLTRVDDHSILQQSATASETALISSFGRTLLDDQLDPAFREICLILPSESVISEQVAVVDPQKIHMARRVLFETLAQALKQHWLTTYLNLKIDKPHSSDAAAVGKRALRNLALQYLTAPDGMEHQIEIAVLSRQQFNDADNMTDRLAALASMASSNNPAKEVVMERFYTDFKNEALVIDKWFSLQATSRMTDVRKIRALAEHPAFSRNNPNRARSLIFSFCNGNPAQFHAIDGSGYELWQEEVIALDKINPQVAARLARSLDRWRKYTPVLQENMHAALQAVIRTPYLSNDTREVVTKALAV